MKTCDLTLLKRRFYKRNVIENNSYDRILKTENCQPSLACLFQTSDWAQPKLAETEQMNCMEVAEFHWK